MPRRLLLLLALGAGPLLAQGPRGLEAGVTGLVTLAEPELAAAGGTVAYRPGGRVRLAATALLGGADGLTGRGEFAAHYLLTPALLRRAGVYGLAGIAGEVGERERGYLLLGVGLEGAPGDRGGWFLEGGIGGGVRLAAGWRWRWLAQPRRR